VQGYKSRMLARSGRRGYLLVVFCACAALVASFAAGAANAQTTASGLAQAPQRQTAKPIITSKADKVVGKLDAKLQKAYESDSTKTLPVFVSVVGSTAGVMSKLEDAHATTQARGVSLVVGRIAANLLVKLASGKNVVAVHLVSFKQDGTPAGTEENPLAKLTGAAKAKAVAKVRSGKDVPFDEAPPPRPSQFQQFKKLNVLDAKTHNFTEAWNDGFTGKGSTVAVFDGGTDWSHPDLIGTKIQRRADGWPNAFDPFGTLQWLLDPSQIESGLSWYTLTTPETCAVQGSKCAVTFATMTGPSRNLPNDPGTAEHEYKFPASWSKSGTVALGSHPDDYALDFYHERPAFLVTDPNTAGVYDTIYVDLNDNYRFGDEKPVTKESPRSWRDLDGDGYVDLSGGMAYYISDGEDGTPVPGGLEAFGDPITGDPGQIVAWTGDFDPGIGGHGTLCASNIVGQGVANGGLPSFDDLPGDGKFPAAVVGGAPRATAVPFGDIYFSFSFSTQLAYLLANLNGIDVTSNSYGNSAIDDDGLDAASQEADIWTTEFGGTTTQLFSSGNGAPGFGTVTGPSPVTGIKVGASTQFGATGWDSINRYSQVNDNDIANWSNRGPASTGGPGIDLVADGAYSPGSTNLMRALDEEGITSGQDAWETWGGTSRSTPVAAGATALVYQAYRSTHPSIPDGFYARARGFLKSGATDLGYESFTQGAGSLNAGRAVRLATGSTLGARVSPDQWRPGDFRGDQYEAFPQLVAPGGSASQEFNLNGNGTYNVSDRMVRRIAVKSFDVTTSDQSEESPYNFNAPSYLVDLTSLVERHSNADLMVVRANYPYDEMDPEDDYAVNQTWRLITYDWTDTNQDGNLWTDTNGNGTVNYKPTKVIDHEGNAVINYKKSEIDKNEYERLTYINQSTNAYTNVIRDPAQRLDSGIFTGFYHPVRSADIPRTHFHFEVEFYKNVDWPWVSTPSSATDSFDATVDVPADAPYGLYEGAIVVQGHGQKTVVPVSVNVGATAQQDENGQLTDSLVFGGSDVDQAQRKSLYNNGSVFDAKDWSWRADSGDWRFFYFDVPEDPPAGTQFLALTDFAGPSPHNDLDTLIFGPTTNEYQLTGGTDPIFAPYALGTVGGSQNTNAGAGVWTFNTATGTNQELVSGPASSGLHAIVEHEVNMQHDNGEVHMPFETTVASATVDPDHVEQSTDDGTGGFDVTFQAGIDLPGFTADAFGLSQPDTTTETAHQDDPTDPTTASVKRDFTLSHAGSLTVSASLANNDIDLYLLRDANDDGTFDPQTEIIAASATASGDESVSISSPDDGDYEVWIHGFSVSGTPTFPLTVDAVQGTDLAVTGVPGGPVVAGTPITLHVTYDKAMDAGEDYFGEIHLGPTSAPDLLTVPVTIHQN
jgi:subtilisin family serine protease